MPAEALGALGEVFAAVVEFLIEVTVLTTRLAWAPMRFLFSARRRRAARHRWRGRPWRRVLDCLGGTAALSFFAMVAGWWITALIPRPEKPVGAATTPPPAASARAKKTWKFVIEKVPKPRDRE